MLAPLPPPSSQFSSPSGNMPAQTWAQYFQSLDQTVRAGGGDTTSITTFPGIDLTGGTGSGAAFNAALATLTNGGTLTIPAGSTIALDQTLNIGNGTSGAVSTIQGVRIVGMGVPSTAGGGGGVGVPAQTPVTFKWIGATNGHVVQVNGPLAGWGLENILIDGGSVAGVTGLNILSGQNGDIRFLTFKGCFKSIVLTAQAGFTSATADAMHNVFYACTVANPAINGCVAITLTGNVPGNANSAFNTFIGTTIFGGGATTENGIYFQACDSNHFFATHMYDGGTASTAVAFDYTLVTGISAGIFPSGNYIDGIDPSGWTTTFANAGTITTLSRANYVRPYEANQAVVPAIDNLVNLQDSSQFPPWDAAAGTAQAITVQFAQTFNNLPDGKLVNVRATLANTAAAPTLTIFNHGTAAFGPTPITKKGNQALAANDIRAVGHELILRFNLAGARWELLNPTT